jgi:hypothetical protein
MAPGRDDITHLSSDPVVQLVLRGEAEELYLDPCLILEGTCIPSNAARLAASRPQKPAGGTKG